MRRLQRPAQVVLQGGRPARVSWSSAAVEAAEGVPAGAPLARGFGRSRRANGGGRVERVIDEWRVAGRWWASEYRRDYYLLELVGGVAVEVYREGEGWWVVGVSD